MSTAATRRPSPKALPGAKLLLHGKPDELDDGGPRRRRARGAGASGTASSASSTTAGRRRSSSSRSRSASISCCIPPRNISAATATSSPASSPARRRLIDRIAGETFPYLGGKLSPFDAWLLLRGLRTLPIRMKAHEAAGWRSRGGLQAHALVEQVCHPGLANRLPPGLNGTSGLFSFIFRDGVDIRAFADTSQSLQAGRQLGRP